MIFKCCEELSMFTEANPAFLLTSTSSLNNLKNKKKIFLCKRMIDIICILNFPAIKQDHWYSKRKYTLKKKSSNFSPCHCFPTCVTLFSSLFLVCFFFFNNLKQFWFICISIFLVSNSFNFQGWNFKIIFLLSVVVHNNNNSNNLF